MRAATIDGVQLDRAADILESLMAASAIDVEEQAFIAGLSGYLSGIHADRVEPSMKDGQCELKLTFRI